MQPTANPHLLYLPSKQMVPQINHHINAVKQRLALTTVDVLDIGGGGSGTGMRLFGTRTDVRFHILDLRCLSDTERCTFYQGDITDPALAVDKKFDIVLTMDTFEHILNPWDATTNMKKLLKDNGRLIFIAPFAWRYHPVPYDLYRYTHTGARYLFERLGGMACIEAGYVIAGNIGGRWKNKKDATSDGGRFAKCTNTFYVAERDSNKQFDLKELDSDFDDFHRR